MRWTLLVLCGCGGVSASEDPEIQALGRASRVWAEGKAAWDAGDAAAAARRFGEARALREGDVLLAAWEADALAAAGDRAGALVLLDGILAARPSFAVARYRRAVLRLQAGAVEAGAADLADALRGGAATPREAARDPDLAPFRAEPALSFLPQEALTLRGEVPSNLAWLGSEVSVKLVVVGAAAGPLGLQVAGAGGPAHLRRVVEDDVGRSDGDRERTLTWTVEVLGAGELRLGVAQVGQGDLRAETALGVLKTAAPGDHMGVAVRPIALWAPSDRMTGRTPPEAWYDDGRTWVAVPPGAEVQGATGALRAELRTDGVPTAELWTWEGSGPVVVRQQGQVLWEGSVGP